MLRAIAVDYGTKRIGVAGCDPLGISVKPLPFVPARPEEAALAALANVLREREAEVVVLGLPLNMDDTEGPAAKAVRGFGERLAAALPAGVEIAYWDERLTTDDAEKRLIEKGLSHRERKQVIDSLSAAILLKSWLDARVGGSAAASDG
jgi:putative Holliday junction resolvase